MGEKELPLVGHLEELRTRIICCLVTLAVAGAAAFPFARHILRILKLPAAGLIDKLVFFSPQEAFTVYVNIAIGAGLVISLPVILYHLWAFISPAIEDRLRRHSLTFISFSLLAFVTGCAFAYYILLPAGLRFLLQFGREDLEPLISAGKYISFVIAIILFTGLVFEMPVLSFMLSRLGIINHRFLRKYFRHAVLMLCIAAAVITPTPDPFNMMLLAVPMVFLYEVSIWVSFAAGRRAGKTSSGVP